MTKDIVLEIGSKIYTGWNNVCIKSSIKTCADGFSITAVYHPDFKIYPLMDCVVYIEGEKLLTGIIEKISAQVSAGGSSLNIQGRSKTCLLLKSSILHRPLQFNGQDLQQIAGIICRDFNLKPLFSANPGEAFEQANASPEDKCFDYLKKLASQRGLLISSTPEGTPIFFKAANNNFSVGTFQYGENIDSISHDIDYSNRFARYLSLAQMSTENNIYQEVNDRLINDNTLLCFQTETGEHNAQRVKWEHAQRVAKSSLLNITIRGWKSQSGFVWKKNTIVSVLAPKAYLIREKRFLIEEVEYSYNTGGKQTKLKLIPPEAHLLETPIEEHVWE